MLGTVPAFAGNIKINDLDRCSGYSREAIAGLFEKGVLTGDSSGNFNPGENITRGQMAAMLVRMLKLDTASLPDKPAFKDVPSGHWAFPYVEAAYRKGIINGLPGGTFGVDAPCTREEMTVMFVRAMGIPENELKQYAGTDKLNSLDDADKLSNWSRDSVGLALSAGLMKGTSPGTFSPDEYAKREQAAVLADRVLTADFTVKTPASNSGNLTMKEIAALEESVVLIKTYDKDGNPLAQGSGFAVAKGLFFTNYHVLEGAYKYIITDDEEKEHEVQGIVKYDEDLDLAVIKTKEPLDIKPLEMGSGRSLAVGDDIAAIGSPQGLQNSISQGKVNGFQDVSENDSDKVHVIEVSADITHGSSGGPLFDMKGKVVGIVTAMSEDGVQKYAIDIDHAKAWIDELKAKPFDSLKVLDMYSVIEAYWKVLDDEVKETVYESFQAMEDEDVEAYMATIHKLNPAYSTIRETYGKLFSIYDFDYTVQNIKIVAKDSSEFTLQVTYTVQRTGKKESVLIGANGYYKLALQQDRWKIFYAAENIYFPEGGSLTGADLISEE